MESDLAFPELLDSFRADLNDLLATCTVASLREIARAWGWPLKGVAKNDIVEQMTTYMMDAQRMRAGYETLTDVQQDVMSWINCLSAPNNESNLAAALSYATNREVSATAFRQATERLRERGFLFLDDIGRPFAPSAFHLWLPPLDSTQLHCQGPVAARGHFGVSQLNSVAYRLISHIDSERPPVAKSASPAVTAARSSMGRPFSRRPGLLRRDVLEALGFKTQDERNQARFVLEMLALGQIIKIAGAGDAARLTVEPNVRVQWDAANPSERINILRALWISSGLPEAPRAASTWNELDLAINAVEGYTLRFSIPWLDPFSNSIPLDQTRLWLTGLLARLAPDRWFGLEEVSRLAYHLRSDLLPRVGYGQWQWYEGDKVIESARMEWPTWRATQGRILEAMLTGPAQWLGMVDIGYGDDQLIGFRIHAETAVEEVALPQDILHFQPPDTFQLENVWQAGPLHTLLSQIAEIDQRDRELISYRMSAPVFRASLEQGLTVEKLAAAFAGKGVPLAPSIVTRLKEWEGRAGRYRLHEQVAIIEFGEDMPPEEIQAIARLGGEWLYLAAPRCLVALEADRLPGLLADLRRRGYTPQVIR